MSISSSEFRQAIRDLETCADKRHCQLILAKHNLSLKEEDLEKLQEELLKEKLEYALDEDPCFFKEKVKPLEKKLEVLTKEVEGLKLKIKALERLVVDSDLDFLRKNLAKSEAEELAVQVPKLLDEYNTNIYNAFTVMQKIKILRQGIFERDKNALKQAVGDERIFDLITAIPPALTLAEWSKGGHSLIALNFDASQKEKIISEMLGK